jgi:hypothetical protein
MFDAPRSETPGKATRRNQRRDGKLDLARTQTYEKLDVRRTKIERKMERDMKAC